MPVKLRKKKLSNGELSLYLDIYHNGKREYEFLNLRLSKDKDINKEVLQVAEQIRAKRELDILCIRHGLVPSFKRKASFIEYFNSLVNERPPDRSSWIGTYKKLKKFVKGNITFSDINEVWLTEFKNFLLQEVSQNTAHHYFSNIRYALNKAIKEKIIPYNPCSLVANIPKPEIRRNYLEIQELEKLVETKCSNENVKRAFLFSCYTGLRYSDIKNLKWNNIEDNKVKIIQQKTKGFLTIPLSETARNILYKNNKILNIDQEVRNNEIIFNIPTKSPMLQIIKKWVKEAGINKNISFHIARHTFATLSISNNVDIYTVSKLLGHKDISTTQIYAKLCDPVKQKAIEKLPQLNIMNWG